jgi:hypothetical protein
MRREYRAFFPPYKQEFQLKTPVGEFTAWVTSDAGEKGGRRTGNYIWGATEMFRRMPQLKAEDTLRVEAVVPQKVYDLRVATKRDLEQRN